LRFLQDGFFLLRLYPFGLFRGFAVFRGCVVLFAVRLRFIVRPGKRPEAMPPERWRSRTNFPSLTGKAELFRK